MTWNPDRYLQFRDQRVAPFDDLLALVPRRPGLRVIDLGCGPGELTSRIADALPESEVLGIDSSPEMLERAVALKRPGLDFAQQRIEEVDGEWDVVVSNAAIQWVDEHERLVPKLFSLLARGGRLAVQVPTNQDHPSQRAIREIDAEEPFGTALGGWSHRWPTLPIGRYAEILFEQGANEIVAMDRIYPHVLEDADAIADWLSGTALVPYFARLPADLHEEFMQRYRARLREVFPGRPVFFGFKRGLFAGTREG